MDANSWRWAPAWRQPRRSCGWRQRNLCGTAGKSRS